MDEQTLKDRLASYCFYHTIRLTESISTAGNPVHAPSQAPVLAALERLDLKGKRVLDVGCRDGLYSFAAERHGAAEVIGIDNDLSLGAVELLIPFLQSSVQMHELNVLDLRPDRFGTFDVVILAGVLYHLCYPVHCLQILKDVSPPGAQLLIETAIFYGYDRHPMLYCPIGDDSPYEPPSCSFFNKAGLTATLLSLGWRVLQATSLPPDMERDNAFSPDPVIDRGVFLCELSAEPYEPAAHQYWHGTHRFNSQFGGAPPWRGWR